ncbi:ADP-ribosylation factor-like protein 14 [Polymixia lowei]
MGQQGSKQPEARVLLLGLDNAGKSTLLYKQKYNVSVGTVPTIGFNVEMIEARKSGKNIALTVWDVGGQERMRQYWKSYHQDAAAIVFVVDSSDTARLDEARQELERTLSSDHLRGLPVVVLANKQDVNGALTVMDITERFNLRKMCSGRHWFVQPCSASIGFGLEEGFRRVAHLIKLPSDPEMIKDNIRDTVHYIRSKSTKSRRYQ